MGNGGNVFFYAAKVDAEALGTDMRQHEKWNPWPNGDGADSKWKNNLTNSEPKAKRNNANFKEDSTKVRSGDRWEKAEYGELGVT